MRKRIVAIAAACLFTAATTSIAQTEQEKKDHDELRALLKTFTQAFNTQQIAPLEPYLHKNFAVTMVNQDVVTKPGELTSYLEKQFKAPESLLKDVKIQPEADILTEFYEGRIGVNRGSSTDTYVLKDGRSITLKTRWSGAAIYQDGKWKVLTAHIGTNPLDNPILSAVESLKWIWGGGGALLGLIVGVLATILLRRKTA
jgi:hypothetical protein